jgi:hypothetical protein
VRLRAASEARGSQGMTSRANRAAAGMACASLFSSWVNRFITYIRQHLLARLDLMTRPLIESLQKGSLPQGRDFKPGARST